MINIVKNFWTTSTSGDPYGPTNETLPNHYTTSSFMDDCYGMVTLEDYIKDMVVLSPHPPITRFIKRLPLIKPNKNKKYNDYRQAWKSLTQNRIQRGV